jgi:Zn-dependent membrane protease YugP
MALSRSPLPPTINAMFSDLPCIIQTFPARLFCLWTQWKLNSTFRRFALVGVQSGHNGAQAAQAVMQSAGVQGARIECQKGVLSDHYDSRAKALCLSPRLYGGQSMSSVAMTAHEGSHAIQAKAGSQP